MNELLTTQEAAAYLRVSPRTIRRWRQNHVLPYVRIGTGKTKHRSIRFRLEDLRRVLEELKSE